jgi:hypothetical protein
MDRTVTFKQEETSGHEQQVAAHAGSSLADFSTLKMEAIRSSETSVQSTTSTRGHTPEDGILKKKYWSFPFTFPYM